MGLLAALPLSNTKSNADIIQIINTTNPGTTGFTGEVISGMNAVLENSYIQGSGKTPGYEPGIDRLLDTSINPNSQFYVIGQVLDDPQGNPVVVDYNKSYYPQVGDTYTYKLGFEDRIGVGSYAENFIKFDSFTIDNPNGVNDYKYTLSVDTDFFDGNDYFEEGNLSEIMATTEKKTETWNQWIYPGDDWRNNRFYGTLTLEALGDPTPQYHQMNISFNPLKDGNYLGASDPLIITYGEIGATSSRNDSTDTVVPWYSEKFSQTESGDYGIYTRSEPFGNMTETLTKDSRPEADNSNVLIESFTNNVYERPTEWIPGVTWNEGGKLEITVPNNNPYFDDFTLTQMDLASFNPRDGLAQMTVQDIDLLDGIDDGFGTLEFNRIGWTYTDSAEVDFLIGPHSSFILTPPTGQEWTNVNATTAFEEGTVPIMHPTTPQWPGDLDGDGSVGSADLDIVRANWGREVIAGDWTSGDLNLDGRVGSADLDRVRAHWGTFAPSTAIPEPGPLFLLLTGLLPGLGARRR